MDERRDGNACEPPSIAYRVWIGVTGHRSLGDDPKLLDQVREVMRRIRRLLPSPPATPVRFGVISPLAEGADRLVAREILADPDAALEVALPLPAEDYLRDFSSASSKAEFSKLIERADLITVLPSAGSRDEAYLSVGKYVVDRCDVLIAVWDGEPARGQGGTAEIYQTALDRGVPLFHIRPAEDYEIISKIGNGIDVEEFRKIDAYNRLRVSRPMLAREVRRQAARWVEDGRKAGLDDDVVSPFGEWFARHLARADLLAERYQHRYVYLGYGLFFGAAAAVTAAAVQRIFMEDRNLLVWLEILLMLSLLGFFVYGRRRKVHGRWISYRSLAERFRAASFLATAEVGAGRQASSGRDERTRASSDWPRRSFEEVWITKPKISATPPDVEALKRFLRSAWIEDQITYHQRTKEKNETRDRLLTRAIEALFVGTLVAVILHALRFDGLRVTHRASDWLVLISIMLPAVGGAVAGIRAQRELLRNAERSSRMAHNLQALKGPLERAPDLRTVRTVANTTRALMLEETQDWFGVMRFHDIELHP